MMKKYNNYQQRGARKSPRGDWEVNMRSNKFKFIKLIHNYLFWKEKFRLYISLVKLLRSESLAFYEDLYLFKTYLSNLYNYKVLETFSVLFVFFMGFIGQSVIWWPTVLIPIFEDLGLNGMKLIVLFFFNFFNIFMVYLFIHKYLVSFIKKNIFNFISGYSFNTIFLNSFFRKIWIKFVRLLSSNRFFLKWFLYLPIMYKEVKEYDYGGKKNAFLMQIFINATSFEEFEADDHLNADDERPVFDPFLFEENLEDLEISLIDQKSNIFEHSDLYNFHDFNFAEYKWSLSDGLVEFASSGVFYKFNIPIESLKRELNFYEFHRHKVEFNLYFFIFLALSYYYYGIAYCLDLFFYIYNSSISEIYSTDLYNTLTPFINIDYVGLDKINQFDYYPYGLVDLHILSTFEKLEILTDNMCFFYGNTHIYNYFFEIIREIWEILFNFIEFHDTYLLYEFIARLWSLSFFELNINLMDDLSMIQHVGNPSLMGNAHRMFDSFIFHFTTYCRKGTGYYFDFRGWEFLENEELYTEFEKKLAYERFRITFFKNFFYQELFELKDKIYNIRKNNIESFKNKHNMLKLDWKVFPNTIQHRINYSINNYYFFNQNNNAMMTYTWNGFEYQQVITEYNISNRLTSFGFDSLNFYKAKNNFFCKTQLFFYDPISVIKLQTLPESEKEFSLFNFNSSELQDIIKKFKLFYQTQHSFFKNSYYSHLVPIYKDFYTLIKEEILSFKVLNYENMLKYFNFLEGTEGYCNLNAHFEYPIHDLNDPIEKYKNNFTHYKSITTLMTPQFAPIYGTSGIEPACSERLAYVHYLQEKLPYFLINYEDQHKVIKNSLNNKILKDDFLPYSRVVGKGYYTRLETIPELIHIQLKHQPTWERWLALDSESSPAWYKDEDVIGNQFSHLAYWLKPSSEFVYENEKDGLLWFNRTYAGGNMRDSDILWSRNYLDPGTVNNWDFHVRLLEHADRLGRFQFDVIAHLPQSTNTIYADGTNVKIRTDLHGIVRKVTPDPLVSVPPNMRKLKAMTSRKNLLSAGERFHLLPWRAVVDRMLFKNSIDLSSHHYQFGNRWVTTKRSLPVRGPGKYLLSPLSTNKYLAKDVFDKWYYGPYKVVYTSPEENKKIKDIKNFLASDFFEYDNFLFYDKKLIELFDFLFAKKLMLTDNLIAPLHNYLYNEDYSLDGKISQEVLLRHVILKEGFKLNHDFFFFNNVSRLFKVKVKYLLNYGFLDTLKSDLVLDYLNFYGEKLDHIAKLEKPNLTQIPYDTYKMTTLVDYRYLTLDTAAPLINAKKVVPTLFSRLGVDLKNSEDFLTQYHPHWKHIYQSPFAKVIKSQKEVTRDPVYAPYFFKHKYIPLNNLIMGVKSPVISWNDPDKINNSPAIIFEKYHKTDRNWEVKDPQKTLKDTIVGGFKMYNRIKNPSATHDVFGEVMKIGDRGVESKSSFRTDDNYRQAIIGTNKQLFINYYQANSWMEYFVDKYLTSAEGYYQPELDTHVRNIKKKITYVNFLDHLKFGVQSKHNLDTKGWPPFLEDFSHDLDEYVIVMDDWYNDYIKEYEYYLAEKQKEIKLLPRKKELLTEDPLLTKRSAYISYDPLLIKRSKYTFKPHPGLIDLVDVANNSDYLLIRYPTWHDTFPWSCIKIFRSFTSPEALIGLLMLVTSLSWMQEIICSFTGLSLEELLRELLPLFIDRTIMNYLMQPDLMYQPKIPPFKVPYSPVSVLSPSIQSLMKNTENTDLFTFKEYLDFIEPDEEHYRKRSLGKGDIIAYGILFGSLPQGHNILPADTLSPYQTELPYVTSPLENKFYKMLYDKFSINFHDQVMAFTDLSNGHQVDPEVLGGVFTEYPAFSPYGAIPDQILPYWAVEHLFDIGINGSTINKSFAFMEDPLVELTGKEFEHNDEYGFSYKGQNYSLTDVFPSMPKHYYGDMDSALLPLPEFEFYKDKLLDTSKMKKSEFSDQVNMYYAYSKRPYEVGPFWDITKVMRDKYELFKGLKFNELALAVDENEWLGRYAPTASISYLSGESNGYGYVVNELDLLKKKKIEIINYSLREFFFYNLSGLISHGAIFPYGINLFDSSCNSFIFADSALLNYTYCTYPATYSRTEYFKATDIRSVQLSHLQVVRILNSYFILFALCFGSLIFIYLHRLFIFFLYKEYGVIFKSYWDQDWLWFYINLLDQTSKKKQHMLILSLNTSLINDKPFLGVKNKDLFRRNFYFKIPLFLSESYESVFCELGDPIKLFGVQKNNSISYLSYSCQKPLNKIILNLLKETSIGRSFYLYFFIIKDDFDSFNKNGENEDVIQLYYQPKYLFGLFSYFYFGKEYEPIGRETFENYPVNKEDFYLDGNVYGGTLGLINNYFFKRCSLNYLKKLKKRGLIYNKRKVLYEYKRFTRKLF